MVLILLSGGFKEFDRIAVRVFNLNLPSARTGFHLVSETEPGVLEGSDATRKVRDAEHDAVPAARFLSLTIRHRPRSGCSGATQQNLPVSERDAGECRQVLLLHREAQMLRVKRHGPTHIFHVVTDTVDTLDERACVNVRSCGMWHGGDCPFEGTLRSSAHGELVEPCMPTDMQRRGRLLRGT